MCIDTIYLFISHLQFVYLSRADVIFWLLFIFSLFIYNSVQSFSSFLSCLTFILVYFCSFFVFFTNFAPFLNLAYFNPTFLSVLLH